MSSSWPSPTTWKWGTRTMDEPQVRMQPRCIVMMVNDHGGESSFFTLESVREIREKRAALKADIDMGLGEGGEADESGLLNLVGLDLYSDGDVESFELSINPAFIGHVKQLTDRAWKSKLVSMGIHPDENKRLHLETDEGHEPEQTEEQPAT
jgi:hypothetical protein